MEGGGAALAAEVRTVCRLAIGALMSLALVAFAAANDSSAELAAGGLVLVKTDSISMQREDLTLSPSEVRVRYEMRNDTGKPVTLRVAFPMPEVPMDTPAGMETSTAHNLDMKPPTDANFIGFHVWVNGQPVTTEAEIRAALPDGRDVTDALREIGGLSLLLRPRVFVLPGDPAERTGPNGGWDLDVATRQKLQGLGALKQDAEGYETLWSTRITFHWMQTFPPGVTVVEHSYRPILGGQIFAAERRGRPGAADADAGVWIGSLDEDLARAYCIDGPTDRAMRSLYKRMLRARLAAGIHDDGYFPAAVLGYILRTAQNWRGPIGAFHLVLLGDKASFQGGDTQETGVMSLCTDLPLRRTAPMRFEATVHDYVPKQDLRVLIVPEGR
jgi:hypothetical protein